MSDWQTDMLHWNTFPWCCENVEYDKEMTDLHGFNDDGTDEIAFYCKAHNYRILIDECPGMDCPLCKIHGHDEFIKHLKGDL